MLISFMLLTQYLFAQSTKPERQPIIDPAVITKDIMSWLNYERDHITWSADYISIDSSANLISKEKFLEALTSGEYLPLSIQTNDASLCYQLFRLEKSVDKDIVNTIRNTASVQLSYYKMEGLPLPGFNFVDLNGKVYNPGTVEGSVVVLNCWFIRCASCIAEIPDLNRLVRKFKSQKNIRFISLAFDAPADLLHFLKTTLFDYAVVPDKKDYLMNTLGIISYPTHLIIDKKGVIVKILPGNLKELIGALNIALGK